MVAEVRQTANQTSPTASAGREEASTAVRHPQRTMRKVISGGAMALPSPMAATTIPLARPL